MPSLQHRCCPPPLAAGLAAALPGVRGAFKGIGFSLTPSRYKLLAGPVQEEVVFKKTTAGQPAPKPRAVTAALPSLWVFGLFQSWNKRKEERMLVRKNRSLEMPLGCSPHRAAR